MSCPATLSAGVITGSVLDPQRSPVPGALVTLSSEAGAVIRSAATDTDGRFRFEDIGAGTYAVKAEVASFRDALASKVVVSESASRVQLELVLELARQQSIITVYEVPERTAASKLDVPLRELPVTVNITSGEQMRQQGNFDLVSALRYTNNLHARTNFGVYEHYTVRGFGDVVQMIDGIRQEDRRFNTQLANVEQVEVLKGPASALYGNSAGGGLLNVIRKKPRNEHEFETTLVGGTWNHKRGSVGATGPIVADRLMYRFDYGFVDFDGYRNAPIRQHLVSPALLWRPSARDQLNVNYQYNNDRFATDSGFPTFANQIPRIPTSRRFNTPFDRALTRDNFVQAYYNRNVTDNIDLRNVVSYRRFDDDYLSTETISLTPPSRVNRTFFYFDRRRTTILNQTEGTVRFGTGPIRHALLGGYEYQRFGQNDDNSTVTNLAAPIDLFNPVETQGAFNNLKNRTRSIRQDVHAVYLQDQVRVGEKFHATFGFRYDPWRRRFRTDAININTGAVTPGTETRLNQNAFTGRVGAVYQVRPSVALYGSFGTLFTPVLSVPVDGSILDPERGRQFEAGTRIDLFRRRAMLTAALFHLEKTNVTIGLGGGRFNQAGRQRSQGAEVSIDAPLTDCWFLRLNYGLTDAKYISFFSGATNLSGRVPVFVPRHTGAAWSTYRLYRGLSLAGGLRTSASSYTSFFNVLEMPGYAIVDASLLYNSRFADFTVNMQNVGNRKWYFVGSVYNTQVYPGTPFGMTVTMRLKWGPRP